MANTGNNARDSLTLRVMFVYTTEPKEIGRVTWDPINGVRLIGFRPGCHELEFWPVNGVDVTYADIARFEDGPLFLHAAAHFYGRGMTVRGEPIGFELMSFGETCRALRARHAATSTMDVPVARRSRPRLVLAGRGGTPTSDDILAMLTALTGKEPTEAEIAAARAVSEQEISGRKDRT